MYGSPSARYGATVYGDIKGDGTKSPLKDVKVRIVGKNSSTLTTDSNGKFGISFWDAGEYEFIFVDGDGAENGSFKSTTKKVTLKYNDSVTDEITLERE